jgi:hypothetical protein
MLYQDEIAVSQISHIRDTLWQLKFHLRSPPFELHRKQKYHNLCHLVEDIINFGPGLNFSATVYEAMNKCSRSYINRSNHSNDSIAAINGWAKSNYFLFLLSSTHTFTRQSNHLILTPIGNSLKKLSVFYTQHKEKSRISSTTELDENAFPLYEKNAIVRFNQDEENHIGYGKILGMKSVRDLLGHVQLVYEVYPYVYFPRSLEIGIEFRPFDTLKPMENASMAQVDSQLIQAEIPVIHACFENNCYYESDSASGNGKVFHRHLENEVYYAL